MDDILKFFDPYNRKARIYPALIAFAPIVWTVLFVSSASVDIKKGTLISAFAVSVLYWFTTIARSRGKMVEERLLKKWGGWPTTISLRHRDSRIDNVTKVRYHAKLSKLCGGLQFPTKDEESNSTNDADDIYRSVTKKLIELRRDPKKYKMLHEENASYGFRRNLLGLKVAALALGVIVAVFTGVIWVSTSSVISNCSQLVNAVISAPLMPLLIVLDTVFVFTFALVVNEKFIEQAAYEYSDALLRTLDMPTKS